MFGATVAMELGAALPVIVEHLQIHRKSIRIINKFERRWNFWRCRENQFVESLHTLGAMKSFHMLNRSITVAKFGHVVELILRVGRSEQKEEWWHRCFSLGPL